MKTINTEKRYSEYWINESCKCHTVFLSEKEVEDYVKKFPRETMILMSLVELDCKGHTYRQIMGLDELDCGVYHEFLERPRIAFLRTCLSEMVNGLQSLFYKHNKQPSMD